MVVANCITFGVNRVADTLVVATYQVALVVATYQVALVATYQVALVTANIQAAFVATSYIALAAEQQLVTVEPASKRFDLLN